MFPASTKFFSSFITLHLLTATEQGTAEERIRIADTNFSASYMPMFIANKRDY